MVHENYSNRHIAKSIERAPQTINNEIKRGTIRQIRRQKNGKVYTYTYQVYDPKLAQSRFEVILKIDGKDAESVDKAVTNLKERAGDQFEYIFKSITSDNGSEFSGLHEELSEILDVYFTHPYASWERGTSENQHKFIRRFIPKGNSMSDLTQGDCLRIQQWMNDYPRKILGYQTPHVVFTKAFKKARQEEGLVSA